nr:membrane transporter [Cryptococcus depauperatus CBS 7841]
MLPPPPSSCQSSYIYPHSRQQSSEHTRKPSVRSIAESALGIEHEDGTNIGLDAQEVNDDAAFVEEQRKRGLEETLERLGFGPYHWRLLALCGFGWMSDNSALQCIAVILPRVQIHFDLSSRIVGLLSASTMAGMMVGAVGWGVISDILGRALPFNLTLFLTGVFGICASFSPNFGVLCFWLFLLGSAVGGSMPTDGTLFLENLPHSKQYLLTLLSIFFSLGAVFSSVVSLIFLPGASCRVHAECDFDNHHNDGWRRVLLILGLFNLACALARWFLFNLQESPRYLVSNGREQEAVVALQTIASYNSHTMNIQRVDVSSHEYSTPESNTRHGLFTVADGNDPSENASYGGLEIAPPRSLSNTPLRTGSSFYKTPGSPNRHEGNVFDQSFHGAENRTEEERERLISDESKVLKSDPVRILAVQSNPKSGGKAGRFKWGGCSYPNGERR